MTTITMPTIVAPGSTHGIAHCPLLLFPSQHRAIIDSQDLTSPLYLRVLLKALHWAASRKMDFWQIFPYWIQAQTVVELYEKILDSWENGVPISAVTTEEAHTKAVMEGGYSALVRKHAWLHQQPQRQPSFKATNKAPDTAMEEEEMGVEDVEQQEKADELPLAEAKWRKAHADAHKVSP